MAFDNISRIIDLTVIRNTVASVKKSFSVPLFIAKNQPVLARTGKTMLFSNADDVALEFGTDTEEHKAAKSFFGQTPAIKSLRIALRETAVATVKELQFSTAVVAHQAIRGVVNGVTLTQTLFTTDMAGTLAALRTKILAVDGIDTVVVTGNNVAITADVEYSLDLTSFQVVGGETQPTVTVATTTAGRTIVDDYLDAKNEVNDFYVVTCDSTNLGVINSLARQANTERKLFIFRSDQAELIQAVTTDIGSKLKSLSAGRAAILYTENTAEYSECAWVGRCLAVEPGQGTWTNRNLTGATKSELNTSEVNNAVGKYVNVYVPASNKGVTLDGRTFDGNYIFVIRNLDYMEENILIDLFNMITLKEILSFDKEGLDTVETELRKTLERMVTQKVLSEIVSIDVPTLDEISSDDQLNMTLPDVTFSVRIGKAIHKIKITGFAGV